MNITELGYAIIGSTNPEKWRAYGTQVLGVAAADGPEGVLFLKMDEREFRFAVQKNSRDCLMASGWGVATEQDFHALRKHLEQAKIATQPCTDAERKVRRVQDAFFFSDPSGLRHEVFWGPISDFARFVSPLGTQFVTGALGLGHVVLPTSKMKETVAFWTKVMGFGLSDILHVQMGPTGPTIALNFFHCANSRQHSLAYCELPDPSDCIHLMVEVDSFDEVGRGLDRIEKHQVQLVSTLGRHVNDDMISFYMRSPSGFAIEYGTGGVVKDWSTHQVFETTRGSYWGHQFVRPT